MKIGVLTGLLWFKLQDLTNSTIQRVVSNYSYPHPYDDLNIFETFVKLDDKIGIPYGNSSKALENVNGCEIIDRRISPSFTTPAEVIDLELRKYQQETLNAIFTYIKNGGVSFNLAGKPGSGKSVLLAALLVRLNIKVLVIAHMSLLTTQLEKEFKANTSADVRVLSSNNLELGDINIATSQFISKRPELWYKIKNEIGVLAVDEAESLASLTTLRIFQRAHAKYRIAVTATFTRSVDKRTEALKDIIGDEVFILDNPELLVPNIYMLKCPERYPPFVSTFMSARQKASFFRKESIMNKVKELITYSLAKNRQVLVAVDIQEFQEQLAKELPRVGILNSTTKKRDRTLVLEAFDAGELDILAAGMVVNAGLSIPKITTIIRVSFPSSPEKNTQLVGRALRDFKGKDGAFIYDLVFAGRNPSKRVKAFRDNGYKVKISTYKEFIDDT